MNESCYVGIDVAMDGFEAAVRPGRKTSKFAYTAAGVRKLLRQLAALTVALVCMEATGGYEQRLAIALAENGYKVAIVNPRRMRRFADASGNLAKTDAIDARVIAHYGEVMNPVLWQRPDRALVEMKELAARRQQLIEQRTRDKNRLGKAASATIRRQIRSSVNYLSNQIERLEKVVQDVLKANPDLKRRYDLVLPIKLIPQSRVVAQRLCQSNCPAKMSVDGFALLLPDDGRLTT